MPSNKGLKRTFIDHSLFAQPILSNATNEQLGAWLRVNYYCNLVENGGVIKGAARWPDEDVCAVIAGPRALFDSMLKRGMVIKRGADIVVFGYDLASAKAYRAMSDGGKRGADRRHNGGPSSGANGGPSRGRAEQGNVEQGDAGRGYVTQGHALHSSEERVPSDYDDSDIPPANDPDEIQF